MARACVEALTNEGLRVFDIPTWSKEEGRLPLFEECRDADVIFAPEPTGVWIGAAIRQELIRDGAGYDGRTIAHAFALDRLILFRRLLIPLRTAGKIIIQDRNVSTSLIYQPTQKNSFTLEELMELEGNTVALTNAPDLLVVADCPAEVAMERLSGRGEKKDNAIFEKLDTLRLFGERFRASWFHDLWQAHGTEVRYLDTNVSLEEMCEAARTIAHSTTAARHASKVLL